VPIHPQGEAQAGSVQAVSGIVFGAIAPHGPIAVREACTDDELELAAATLTGFDQLAERCAAAELVVGPARDLPAETHVAAGRALADAAGRSGKRVAFVASADHGHAHAESGPYGYDEAAVEYDELVRRLVDQNRLDDLRGIDPGLVERAAADSWWQLLMLHGALGDGWSSELLSYEAPTYYGMLCAAFTPSP
jgi:Catalytic LigB subunit of aromatic ring-opening dioxygenase